MGNRRVDLLVASEVETEWHLAIVLKTEHCRWREPVVAHVHRLRADTRVGLAPRGFRCADDGMPENSEKWGDFSRATLFDILGTWKEVDMPKSGKDWLDALRHERTPADPGMLRSAMQPRTARLVLSIFSLGE